MAEDKVYLLTQEAYNKMKEELAHREGELREGDAAGTVAVFRRNGNHQTRTHVMARHSLVPALDDLSHADAETGGLMTVEAGVEWGVLTPHHAVVVHGDGVAATHDRAVSLGQLHNLEALRGFGRREC